MTTAHGTGSVVTAGVIECRGIEKRYGGIHALRGVDLTLTAGRIHGLIGPNGAGKSTLVKILVGAEQPDAGAIFVDSEKTAYASPQDAAKYGIALMPQELSVVPTMSVVDNVTLGSEAGLWGMRSGKRCAQAAAAALDLLHLDIPLNADVESLSGAHKRLIMMARALHKGAQCIVLDEPTAGLHPHEMELVRSAITRLSREHGVTILLVSHHLSEVADLCEEVVCIGAGEKVAHLHSGEVTAEALVSVMHGAADIGSAIRIQDSDAESADRFAIDDIGPPAAVVSEEWITVRPRHAAETVTLEKVSGRRLTDVSIAARVSEVIGVTGLLGSGLSEVVDLLVGSDQPMSGNVTIDGAVVRLKGPDDAARAGIGYTSGERAKVAFTDLSIRRNTSISALTAWFGSVGFIRSAVERRRSRSSLEVFDIPARDHLDLSSLSGGNQQRVLLARLLAAEFGILVLEEPTVGVDIVARESIWSIVRGLRHDHVVIVISSENDELEAMCDRVYCLRGGSVSAELSGDDLTRRKITESII